MRGVAELTGFARAVLDAVAQIPPGKVLSYGDVAELIDQGSARTVGTVMGRYGAEVPWHRVVPASGVPVPRLRAECLALLRAEGCPVRGERVVMADARWDGR